jgi:membrane associated rhomboid family serine protease
VNQIEDNPITVITAIIISVIYTLEYYVLLHSQSLFEYLFITKMKLTPGILLGPLSHGPLQHFAVNILFFFMYGSVLERRMTDRHYASILILTAYIPVYAQVVSDWLVGDTGTVGFSGAVYAIIPLYTLLALQDWSNLSTGEKSYVIGGLVSVVYIPLTIIDIATIGSLPGAKITHTLGFFSGLIYGGCLYRNDSKFGE